MAFFMSPGSCHRPVRDGKFSIIRKFGEIADGKWRGRSGQNGQSGQSGRSQRAEPVRQSSAFQRVSPGRGTPSKDHADPAGERSEARIWEARFLDFGCDLLGSGLMKDRF